MFGQLFNPDATTTGWLYRALALLVVACPCAGDQHTGESLPAPSATVRATASCSKAVQPSKFWQKYRPIALDKTGTLTRGRPAVTQVSAPIAWGSIRASCAACDDVLALASAVEQHSEHPLAHAIISEATARRCRSHLSGGGIRCRPVRTRHYRRNQRHTVTIGSHAYFDERVPHNAFVPMSRRSMHRAIRRC